MAKAVFHKHQRVFVKPVGTWALVEKVKPQWVKDVAEPIKVFYDCGLGRDFIANELSAEAVDCEAESGQWRLMRLKNKWQTEDECAHHPVPGTYPCIVTDKQNWGGWRVPGAEYDRDPARIEAQARLIAHAPRLVAFAEAFARAVAENPEASADQIELARRAKELLRAVKSRPDDAEGTGDERPRDARAMAG